MDRSIISLCIGLGLTATGCGRNQKAPAPPTGQQTVEAPISASPPLTESTNDALLAAASPFEDLTEYAEAGNTAGMDSALARYRTHAEAVHALLAAPSATHLDSLVAAIETARQAGDNRSVALDAVESFRTLIENLDESTLAVPKAVSLLDYAGFRIVVLATATGEETVDWPALQHTVGEARGFWTSIEGRIDDPALADAMNTTVQGMEKAVEMLDLQLAKFAGQIDLDLVDLLEHYFEAAHTGP